jgi:hypothetical protein
MHGVGDYEPDQWVHSLAQCRIRLECITCVRMMCAASVDFVNARQAGQTRSQFQWSEVDWSEGQQKQG